jgi:hypothetical protein
MVVPLACHYEGQTKVTPGHPRQQPPAQATPQQAILYGSQADSAGSIPVTRSKDKAQAREILPDLGFCPSGARNGRWAIHGPLGSLGCLSRRIAVVPVADLLGGLPCRLAVVLVDGLAVHGIAGWWETCWPGTSPLLKRQTARA